MAKETKNIELKDTVKDMDSDDYKKRFIAEYSQLCIRINKLNKFIGKIKYAKYADVEEPNHDCPVDLLEKQLFVMNLYRVVLQERAEKYEHIKLPNVYEG